MKWHKYPDEKPTENKQYLIYECGAGTDYYDVADYCTDLYKLDNWKFSKYKHKDNRKSGFVQYDSEFGYVEALRVIAWCEIEEYK